MAARLRHLAISVPDVAAAQAFFEQMPKVVDGASDLFRELFGPERGRHARAAVGMASLPRQQPVEISGEFEVTDR